jgi:hypothetical protein
MPDPAITTIAKTVQVLQHNLSNLNIEMRDRFTKIDTQLAIIIKQIDELGAALESGLVAVEEPDEAKEPT